MSRKRTILKGTLILSFTGIITRLIGFFYRIFLSQSLGETGVGLYQLIFPVYALGFSFSSAGTEIAISRLVAKYKAVKNHQKSNDLLRSAVISTLLLSFIFSFFLMKYSNDIAIRYLHHEDTSSLLRILSFVFPLASIHSCIVGYYLGLKQTKIPSLSQIIEQCFRVFSVFIIFIICTKLNFNFKISFAVLGLVVGEAASCIFCIKNISNPKNMCVVPIFSPEKFILNIKEIFTLSLPITFSRILLNILQSIEAINIPLALQKYGLNQPESLSIYGVFTGMALPCILFPSAMTNAVSTMLLPTVSEIQATKNQTLLSSIVRKSLITCTFFGILCCILFLTFGQLAGNLLFKSKLAGRFIITLAWMCPFLYANNTLLSIINGIGRSWISLTINVVSLIIRICSIIFYIPSYGILGYLSGLLLSQIIVFLLCIFFLFQNLKAEVP